MEEQRIVELLTRKIAGEATPDELGELSYLLSKYPDSVYYEALLEQVWDIKENSEQQDINHAFGKHKSRFKADLEFEVPAKGFSKIYRKPSWLITAVTFIFLITGAAIFIQYYNPVKVENVEIVAGRGVRKEIKLPDGTVVRLNSESSISYKSDMVSRAQREIMLTGEAYFNVKHDKEHPFIVRTGKIKVKVLGTEFNVKEYPGERESETTLLKGSVELTINKRAEQKFVLKPSEKFALLEKRDNATNTDNNSTMIIENVSPVKLGDKEYIREVTWTENKLVFQNESFENLLPKLERWYNVKLTLQDPKIGAYRFTGVFINENVLQAMEAMQLIKPFNYKLNENNEIKIY